MKFISSQKAFIIKKWMCEDEREEGAVKKCCGQSEKKKSPQQKWSAIIIVIYFLYSTPHLYLWIEKCQSCFRLFIDDSKNKSYFLISWQKVNYSIHFHGAWEWNHAIKFQGKIFILLSVVSLIRCYWIFCHSCRKKNRNLFINAIMMQPKNKLFI